jgi:Na+-translocating ferredoxin:NAD+ oxidoreductase subunit B
VIMPQSHNVYVSCRTTQKGKAVATVCKAGCIGCSLCTKKCPEGAITMENNLPVIDYDKCTGCGICAEICPKHTIVAAGPGKASCADPVA